MSLLTRPYVTAPEFRASPTWLDTRQLVEDGDQAAQDAELGNVLLRASAWAAGACNQRLDAHAVLERMRVEAGADGRVSIHASVSPVRKVTALSYGTPGNLTPLSDLSGVWVEDDVQIITSLGVVTGWGGFLEFGRSPAAVATFVQLGYVAGHTVTTLAAPAISGVSTLTVADPTGIYPGDVLRIWEPGVEEAVTVASGYVPGSAAVGLAAATTAAHTAGAGMSALPADVHQAVISRTAAMLLRGDVAGAGDYPEAPYDPAAIPAGSASRASELSAQARALLLPYRRVR